MDIRLYEEEIQEQQVKLEHKKKKMRQIKSKKTSMGKPSFETLDE